MFICKFAQFTSPVDRKLRWWRIASREEAIHGISRTFGSLFLSFFVLVTELPHWQFETRTGLGERERNKQLAGKGPDE